MTLLLSITLAYFNIITKLPLSKKRDFKRLNYQRSSPKKEVQRNVMIE
jgi:hypothetical protein